MTPLHTLAPALLAAALAPAQAATCTARSSDVPPAIVELYTSEGCSSCPPADRWLSALKGRSDVLALAFHVNYWDRLGWPDRFATAAITERQHALQRAWGAPYVYTPQVVLNGRDLRAWSGAALPRPATSEIAIALERDASGVRARISAPASSSRALAGLDAQARPCGDAVPAGAGVDGGGARVHAGVAGGGGGSDAAARRLRRYRQRCTAAAGGGARLLTPAVQPLRRRTDRAGKVGEERTRSAAKRLPHTRSRP
jgi:hypothetical protein